MKKIVISVFALIVLAVGAYVFVINSKSSGSSKTTTTLEDTDFCQLLISERGMTRETLDTLVERDLSNFDVFNSKNEVCANLLAIDDVNNMKDCEGDYDGIRMIDSQKNCLIQYIGTERAEVIFDAQYGEMIRLKELYDSKYN